MNLVRALPRSAKRWLVKQLALQGVDGGRGWRSLWSSTDRPPGSWQQDREVTQEGSLRYAPVYACATLIASDIGKICLRLMGLDRGVWVETTSAAFSPVLRKPNHFQSRQQFIETWVLSKLFDGNAYILKVRDNRQVVVALYVLAPDRVTPLVAPDGAVYYRIARDDLSKLPQDMPAVPASEIIHDRMECLFHPLVGISPLFAALLSSAQGLRIQQNSEKFFRNQSRPGGMLTAPEFIDDETAARLQRDFEKTFSGDGMGRLFVGGDGLKYEPIAENALNMQLVDQLKLSAEQVCAAFHVPPYMIGAAPTPTYANAEPLMQQYYSQCLQKFFNAIEDLLDDGLGMTAVGYRSEFELDDLLRMDSVAQAEVVEKLSKAAILAPNEARAKFGYLPVSGGTSPYLQQQNYSLEALAKRDAQEDPFASGKTAPALPAPPADDATKAALETARFIATLTKEFEHV